ncbi:MAG: DNA translocase FtsK [Burkholderiaceae bacterium]|nr:MAG: DNA translocase FtsK [Burkholderiaceae bacterium]
MSANPPRNADVRPKYGPGAHTSSPGNPRLSKLWGECRWLLTLVLALYLLLILVTYRLTDPGWSHGAVVDQVANRGGRFGAWLADLLLYLFGFSTYWWCVLLLGMVVGGYRALHRDPFSSRPALESHAPRWLRGIGFALLLSGSVGIEALRLYSLKAQLPGPAGGVFGDWVGPQLNVLFGFTGATMLLLLAFAVGMSLFSGISWLAFAEGIGAAVDNTFHWIVERWQARQDRKIGAIAAELREEVVVQERSRFIEHEPIRIEPQVTVVPRSERAERERQAPLFADISNSALPPLSLLDAPPQKVETVSADTLEFTSRLIEKKLADFGVQVKVVAAHPGPVITRYEIEPATGIKGSTIVNLAKDLARALSLVSIRVVETIPGKNLMGLELPNSKRQTVKLTEILGSRVYNDSSSFVTLALGKDIAGHPVVADLAKMPHLLVAGTTGSGKSVGINAMILSLLYKADPSQVRLIMIDPKMLEMSVYEGIPHLLAPVVTDMKQAANALTWAVGEMERRYKLMSKLGVRNLSGYNAKIAEAAKREEHIPNPFSLTPDQPEPLTHLPVIVVLIDELADLMMVVGKKVEELIARIAQKARAAGVHLILATQRPSVDVITGLIKANIPTRIAFQVSSKIDSRTILDQMGAETLLGQGDMLYLAPGTGLPVRVHGAYVSDEEVHRVVEHLKELGEPNYIDGILEGGTLDDGDGASSVTGIVGDAEADPMYDEAVEIVLKNRRASISLVQRHLRIGYNRAARLLEQMEKSGLVSAMQSNGNRDILVPKSEN